MTEASAVFRCDWNIVTLKLFQKTLCIGNVKLGCDVNKCNHNNLVIEKKFLGYNEQNPKMSTLIYISVNKLAPKL
jgi:hypothetical protein